MKSEDIKGYFLCYRLSVRYNGKTSYWLSYISCTTAGNASITIQEKAGDFNGPVCYKQSTANKYKIQWCPMKNRLKDLNKKVRHSLKTQYKLSSKTTAIEDCIRACVDSMLNVPANVGINLNIMPLDGYII